MLAPHFDEGDSITRSLGLDIGDKRIGVALSDSEGILASPLIILDAGDEESALEAIVGIVHQHQVGQIIVGLPRLLGGGLGRQAEKVQAFVAKLRGRTGVPLEFRDERLTTVSARRLRRSANRKKTRRSTGDDAAAAALILQGYLDETRS